MVISLFSVRDISCHAYHALTLCDVARRARLSILSFIHFVKNYPVNIVISTSRLLTCANRTTARRFWFRQSATKWVETLRPKWTFWRFPDFKRGKDNVSSPIPSMQCCATVRATFRKQETSQLWMEGTGEGCGFLCFRSYPIWVQCLNNFVADCRLVILKGCEV